MTLGVLWVGSDSEGEYEATLFILLHACYIMLVLITFANFKRIQIMCIVHMTNTSFNGTKRTEVHSMSISSLICKKVCATTFSV